MENKNLEEEYFLNEYHHKTPRYLSRFPELNFKYKKILDFGCGHGALSFIAIEKCAKYVVGIDLDKSKIDFANNKLNNSFKNFKDRITFLNIDISDLDIKDFNYIISKATFEHVTDLKNQLKQIKIHLNKEGLLFSGFGPLYNSPYGDHKRTKSIIPWGHLIIPQRLMFKRISKIKNMNISSLSDLGLNGFSLKDYENLFQNSGMKVIDFRVNVSEKKSMILFNLMTKIPFLKEFFSFNIYTILQKKSSN